MGTGASTDKVNLTPQEAAEAATNLSDHDTYGPKIVELFNNIENIRGSKDNSISWTELEDFFKNFKGMGMSEAVRNRKEMMLKVDKNADNRISLHEFKLYVNDCGQADMHATKVEIDAELSKFHEKQKLHERHRALEAARHEDYPGLISKIELVEEATVTPEDILDAHLFHENHDTSLKYAGIAPKGATHKGVFAWIRHVLTVEDYSETRERTICQLFANRRLWRDPNNSGQSDFSDLQRACRSARRKIGLKVEKDIYAAQKLDEKLGALGNTVKFKLPAHCPRYLYSEEDVLSHVDWKIIKHLDGSPCVGGAELDRGALVLAKFTDAETGEVSERYFEAEVQKCHSTTQYELLYYTKEVHNNAVPRLDEYLPMPSADLFESDPLYLSAVTCMALAFLPLVSERIVAGFDKLDITYRNHTVGGRGPTDNPVTGDGICTIRPYNDIIRAMNSVGPLSDAHAPRPAAVLNYIRSVVVCKDVATLQQAYAAVAKMGLVIGVDNKFSRGFDAIDTTGGVRHMSVQVLAEYGGHGDLHSSDLTYSWGKLFDLETTEQSWKAWLKQSAGSVRRNFKTVERWLKEKMVREQQAKFIFTVELHLEVFQEVTRSWPYSYVNVIAMAPSPKSLFTRYAKIHAATKIQSIRRGSLARNKAR